MTEVNGNAKDEEKEVLECIRKMLDEEDERYQNLIGILQRIQDSFGYVPKRSMVDIAARLGVSPANVFGVATFYNQFRFSPPGKCHIKVCLGTACHIKGGGLIMDHWKRKLEIDEGGRTEDGEYSLERVACVGCCTLAPVCVISDKVEGGMSPTRVDGILLSHQIEREQAAKEAASSEASDSGVEK